MIAGSVNSVHSLLIIDTCDLIECKMFRKYEKQVAILVTLCAGRTPIEIVAFLKLSKDLVYRVKMKLETSVENPDEFCPSRKKHESRSDTKEIFLLVPSPKRSKKTPETQCAIWRRKWTCKMVKQKLVNQSFGVEVLLL